MRWSIILTFLICSNWLSAQQGLIPLHSFYKDQLFANKTSHSYNEGSFLPACENDYNLIKAINDSTPQYYNFTHVLFQKYLFEITGKDYYLKISPAIDFAYGVDLADTVKRTLFQNTRGLHVEGNLFKNFSFSTSLYENQARFTNYESQYYASVGELYSYTDTVYYTQNGVVPGGGRTKPFKVDGFDYAYAVGYFVYQPFNWLRIMAGNNSQFIGDGHRSLLLSDNSYSAPYYRLNFKIGEKFNFVYHRARLMNLMRRPVTGSVESYYEPKMLSVNYYTYKPIDNLNISLFEGGIWSRGDSITSKNAHPLYYNPVPVLSGLILKGQGEVSSLLGLNIGYQFAKKHRLYSQFAMNDFDAKKVAFQLGYRGYNFFKLKDFMVQLEYNYIAPRTYEVRNRRLNYSHYNLPLAHPKGNGFNEILFRSNYEWKRIYADLTVAYYITQDYAAESLLPIHRDFDRISNEVFYETLELGYRFNRKMNLCLFVDWTYRTQSGVDLPTNFVCGGIRTGFINHYKDF